MKTLLLCFLTFTSPVASFFMFNEEPAESNQPTYNPFAPTSVVDPYSFWFSGSSNSASENAESATPLHGAYSSPYSTSGSSYGNYQQPQQYNTFSNYNSYSNPFALTSSPFLDSLFSTMYGTPSYMMNPWQQQRRQQRRVNPYQIAKRQDYYFW